MNADLNIRFAAPDDAEALLDLYVHLSSDNTRSPSPTARDTIAKLSRFDGSGFLIGLLGAQIVTSCMVIIIPNLTRGGAPFALIENVVTDPNHRCRGYGKAILDAASDRAWAQGCYKVMLSTGSSKPATHAFYLGAGFEQSRTGFQKRRLPQRPE